MEIIKLNFHGIFVDISIMQVTTQMTKSNIGWRALHPRLHELHVGAHWQRLAHEEVNHTP